jgi:MtN3 and saliva related transmembrane protein
MDAVMVTGLGMVGTALSTLSLVPQVVHTWRTRSAADLFRHLARHCAPVDAGVDILCSLVEAPAIVWANALTFLQAGYLLAVKLQTERRRPVNRTS